MNRRQEGHVPKVEVPGSVSVVMASRFAAAVAEGLGYVSRIVDSSSVVACSSKVGRGLGPTC